MSRLQDSTFAYRRFAEEGRRAAEEGHRLSEEARRTLALKMAAEDARKASEDARRAASEAKRLQRLQSEGAQKVSAAVFSRLGVTSAFLRTFLETHGSRLRLMTTGEVCTEIIRPLTAAAGCSYCELLQSQGHPEVAPAYTVVSHAWAESFLGLVETLLRRFEGSKDVLWIDVFSFNQHASTKLAGATIEASLTPFASTVLVMNPPAKPSCLQRLWCLFETYCCIEGKGKLEVVVSDEESLNEAIRTGKTREQIETIDIIDASASDEEDKKLILEDIQATVGFEAFNSFVRDAFKDLIIDKLQKIAENANDDELELLTLNFELGRLYVSRHRYDDAEAVFKKCVNGFRFKQGDDHPDTLNAMKALMNLYCAEGRYDQAQPLFQELFPWAGDIVDVLALLYG